MITGNLVHVLKFIDKEAGELIEAFYNQASTSTPNGEYPLKGEEIFAKVLSYDTSPDNNEMVEAHNQYVDVQVLLSGAEKIKVYNRSDLETRTIYNSENDCEFFYPANDALVSDIVMKPETLAVLFPQDAHLAALNLEKESGIKKIVFKVYEKYFA